MIFPFKPQTGMTEKIIYVNSITTAFDSTEERKNIEDIPNIQFSFSVKKTNVLSNFLNAMAISQRDNEFILPFWTDFSTYETSISSGVTSLTFDTTKKRYNVGDYLVIWESDLKYESLEIETITDTSITFTDGIVNDYTSGLVYLIPAYISYMVENPTISYTQSSLNTSSFTFICECGYEIDDWVPDQEYKGIPLLFDCEVFDSNTGQNQYTGSSEIINLAGNILDLYKQWDYSKVSRTFGWSKVGSDDIWEFRKFLNYLKGTWKPVYIPSLKNDLIPSEDIASSNNFIKINNCNYNKVLNTVEVRKKIIIFHSSGYLVKDVLNFAESTSDVETCNLKSSLGIDLKSNEVKICFLIPYRSASDEFEIKWNRSDFIECSNNFIEEKIKITEYLGCLAMAEIQEPLAPIDGNWCLAMEEITVWQLEIQI